MITKCMIALIAFSIIGNIKSKLFVKAFPVVFPKKDSATNIDAYAIVKIIEYLRQIITVTVPFDTEPCEMKKEPLQTRQSQGL